MPLSADNKMRAGLAVALLILLLAALISHQSTRRSSEAYLHVDHTREVMSRLDHLLIALLGVENASRGHLISGDESFLNRMQADLEAIAGSPRAIRRLCSDNPTQLKRLDTLMGLLDTKTAALLRRAEVRRKGDMAAALGAYRLEVARSATDEIQKLVMTMQNEEAILLQQRIASAEDFNRKSSGVIFCGSLMAVLFVGLAGLVAQRDSQRRIRAENAAQAARAYAENIVNTVREPLLAIDQDLRVRSANRTFYHLFQLTPAKLEGRALADILEGSLNLPQIRNLLAAAPGEDTPLDDLEVTHQSAAGPRVWLLNGRKFTDTQTGRPMLLLAMEDVTERKQTLLVIGKLNADLGVRAAQLEATNQELEAFSYSVSHDLRAPVRHIHGFVDLLRKNSEPLLDQKGRRFLDTISDSARHMGRLIDDLLAFSRMGRMEIHCTEVDLNVPAAEAVRSQQPDLNGRNILWAHGNLPTVTGDPSLLRLVFENLVANAVKYSQHRDPAHIEIGAREDSAEVVVFVRDNGVGFDMQYAHKLFGVFQRLHSAAEFEGTGIGLANVRRIISRHGGRTWAEGRTDEGATFYFSLPKQKRNTHGDYQTHTAG